MIGYSACESALIETIVNTIPDKFTMDNCKSGDIDAVIKYMFQNKAKYGCVLDFISGVHKKPEGFARPIWQWDIHVAMFMMINKDTVECDMRSLIDEVARLFSGNFDYRLGNRVAKAELALIESPEAYTAADMPLFTLPLVIYIWDKE